MLERVTKASRQLLYGQLFVNVTTTALTWVLLRAAAPAQVAVVPLTLFLGSLYSVLLTLGTGTMLLRSLPRVQDSVEGRTTAMASLWVARQQALKSMGFIVLTAPVAFYVLVHTSLQGSSAALALSVMAAGLLLGLGQSAGFVLQGLRDYGGLTRSQVLMSLIQQVGAVALFFVWGVYGILVALAASGIPPVVTAWRSLRRTDVSVEECLEAHRRDSSCSGREAQGFRLHAAMRFVVLNSDYLVLTLLLPRSLMALYWVAYKPVNYVFMAAQSVFRPMVTELAAGTGEQQRELAESLARGTFVLFAGVVGAVMAGSTWFMRYYGGPKYAAGAPVMVVLAAYAMFFVLYSVGQGVVLASSAPSRLLLLEITTGVVGLGVSVMAGLAWGPVGVALGQMSGMISGFVVSAILARQVVRPTVYLRPLMVVLVAACCSYWPALLERVSSGLVLAPMACGVGVVVYFLLASRLSDSALRRDWMAFVPPRLSSALSGWIDR